MKIIIEYSPFKNMTGRYCDIDFENGVSVGMFSLRDAQRLKASIPARILSDEEYEAEFGETKSAVESKAKVIIEPKVHAKSVVVEAEKVKKVEEKTEEPEEESTTTELVALYNKEELEDIADKDGISGLRELGDKHGIKGRSIAELIDELMDVKEKKA